MSVDPRRLLMLDAVGAIATALTTASILAAQRIPTGLPSGMLYVLAAVAALFFLFSLTGCLTQSQSDKLRFMLRIISIGNFSYCIVTLVLCTVYWKDLTIWGIIYFPLESIVVVALASFEWKVGARPLR